MASSMVKRFIDMGMENLGGRPVEGQASRNGAVKHGAQKFGISARPSTLRLPAHCSGAM